MARTRSDDSKHTRITIRETLEEKRKLNEYARLNHMSLAEYIRSALEIRNIMTQQTFNLNEENESYDDYSGEYDDENEGEYDS